MNAGIAIASPNNVVMRASEIPPEIDCASPVPSTAITLKVLINPDTVPISPYYGAIAAVVAMDGSQRLRDSFTVIMRS